MRLRNEIVCYVLAAAIGGGVAIWTHWPEKPSSTKSVATAVEKNRSILDKGEAFQTPAAADGASFDAESDEIPKTGDEPDRKFEKSPVAWVLPNVAGEAGILVDEPQTKEELDRAFARFLTDQGLPADALYREVPVAPASEPEAVDPAAAAEQAHFKKATETLMDDYPVADARRKASGEVWIRIDSNDGRDLSMEEMTARAAELYGLASQPLKVVVWSGNRPQKVETFNGHPMF